MKNKFRALFTENIWLKFLSVVIGVAIWAVLSNTQDPAVTRTVSVPVTYQNGDQLIREEKHVFLSGPDTVQISVTVRQSNLNRLKSDLFSCTADLMDHSGGDLKSQRVHISVIQTSGFDVVIDWSYYKNDPNITVVLDEYIEKDFAIGLLTTEAMSEDMVLENSIELDPASVRVSGPMSRFGNIASVKATLDLSQLSDLGAGAFKLNLPLKLYDANDNEVANTDGVLRLASDSTKIHVSLARVSTLQVKAEGVSGTPADGYRFLSMTVSPSVVTVHGKKANIGDFTEIVIPEKDINIDGISEDTVYSIDIGRYLPEGMYIGEESGFVQVTVCVEQTVSEQVHISKDLVSVNDKSSLFNYTLEGNVTVLNLNGFREDLSLFNAADLNPYISVSGLEAGRHSVKVNVNEIPGYTFENADALYITVVVTPVAAEPVETEPVPTQSSDSEPTEPTEPSESETSSETETSSESEPAPGQESSEAENG